MTSNRVVPKIHKVKAEICKRNFFYFVQEFWSVIIPDEPVYNWHIEYLCNELQAMVERVAKREDKLYDLIIRKFYRDSSTYYL